MKKFFVFLLLAFAPVAAIPHAEVYKKCLLSAREQYEMNLDRCPAGHKKKLCRKEADKEKKELLEYCSLSLKK